MEDTSRSPSPSPSSISTRSSSESDNCSEIQDTTESDSGDDEMLAKLRASFLKNESGPPTSVETIKNEDSKPVKFYPIFQQPLRSISTQPSRVSTDKVLGGTQKTIDVGSTSIKHPNSTSPQLVSGPKSVMINLQSPSSRHSAVSVIPIQIKTNTKRPVSPDIVEGSPHKRKVPSKLNLKAQAVSSTTPSLLGNVERSNKICEEAVEKCSTLRDIRKHLIQPQHCRDNHFEKVQNLYRTKQFHPRQIEVSSKLDIHQPLDSHAGSSFIGIPKNELSSMNSFFKRLLADARSLPMQETFCGVTDLFPTLNQTVISPKSTASQLGYLAAQPLSPKIPHFTYSEKDMLNLVPDSDKKSLRHLESQSFVTGKIDCLIKPDCLKKEPLDEHPGGGIKLEPMCLQSPAEMKYCTSTSLPAMPSETENVNFKNGFILDYLREEKIKADTIIQLKDGSIGAHRLVLASVSPFLGALLLDQADKSMCRIMIPDIRLKTMKKIIEFIYTGKLNYKPKEGLKIQAALHLLRLMACTGYHVTKIEPEVQPKNIESLGSPNQTLDKEEEERLKVVLPPPPGPETEITGISDSTSITLQEQENKVESQGLPKDPNNFYSVTTNKDFICNFCSKRFKSLNKLFLHFDTLHKGATILPVSEEEMKIITKCDYCYKQCRSPGAAHECLKKHGYIRCWSCLETFDRELIRQHYLIHHVDERSKDDARNTFVKCRWCHHLLNIKSTLINLAKHACSHLDDCPKTGRKRRYTESIDISDESPKELEKQRNDDRITINPEGQVQYRTLNLKGTEDFQLRAAIISPSAPPRFVMNERGKVNINFRKLPKPSCQIPEIPKEIVKLLRKKKND